MTERLQQDASRRQELNQQWDLENPLSNFTTAQIIILREGSTWSQADIDADNKCLSYSCPILAGVPDVDDICKWNGSYYSHDRLEQHRGTTRMNRRPRYIVPHTNAIVSDEVFMAPVQFLTLAEKEEVEQLKQEYLERTARRDKHGQHQKIHRDYQEILRLKQSRDLASAYRQIQGEAAPQASPIQQQVASIRQNDSGNTILLGMNRSQPANRAPPRRRLSDSPDFGDLDVSGAQAVARTAARRGRSAEEDSESEEEPSRSSNTNNRRSRSFLEDDSSEDESQPRASTAVTRSRSTTTNSNATNTGTTNGRGSGTTSVVARGRGRSSTNSSNSGRRSSAGTGSNGNGSSSNSNSTTNGRSSSRGGSSNSSVRSTNASANANPLDASADNELENLPLKLWGDPVIESKFCDFMDLCKNEGYENTLSHGKKGKFLDERWESFFAANGPFAG